jgi:outer membrane protein OmpA-like peptidoglycan-associated protein/outer membrane protein W
MKNRLMLMFMVASAALGAQEGPKWAGVELGGRNYNGAFYVRDALVYGLDVGSWFSPRWGAEVIGTRTRLNQRFSTNSGFETHLLVSALYNLDPSWGKVIPYLRAGLGATRVPSPFSGTVDNAANTAFAAHAGGGFQFLMGEHWESHVEVRGIQVEAPSRHSEGMLLVGLGVRWGGHKAAPALEPAPQPAPPPPAPPPQPPPPPPPPEPQPQAQAPAPPEQPEMRKFVLDDATLHFVNDSCQLSPDGAAAVLKVADCLERFHGPYTLLITGHSSASGPRAHNLVLSRQRAEAVAKVLQSRGIPASIMTVTGMGPDMPLADNRTAGGATMNRRVEIEVRPENRDNLEIEKSETALEQGASQHRRARHRQ